MSDAYDPQAVEGKAVSNQYVSKRDVKIVAIVLVVLAIALYPVYIWQLGNVNKATCAKHFRQIGNAMNSYIEDHDGRYPYAYATAGFDSVEPAIRSDGLTYTWQWDLRLYLTDKSVFTCPTADPSENNRSTGDGSEILLSSYGMLFAYSGLLASTVSDPKSQLLLGETTDMGRRGTRDPLPLIGVDGTKATSDGFLIGFDNSNTYPDAKTQFPTRLAYPESATKGFSDETETRHPGGNHFLYADGHQSKARDATIGRINQAASGLGPWNVPKQSLRQ